MGETIRVLLADDQPVALAGLHAILEQALDIEVGEARDGVEAQQLVTDLRPEVLLLDLVMPGLRPFEIEEWVRTNHPETITLVLTAHGRDCFLAQAVEAGVAGFLTKEESPHRLVEAIRRAVKGEVLITREQLERALSWHKEVGERWERLTEREREVLRLMAEGLDNKDIAGTLGIQVRTVEQHITHILHKLGLSSRLEAVVWVRDRLAEELWESPA